MDTLKTIFELALKGYGAVKICDYLIQHERPCWTYTQWSTHYISLLLRSRHPLGEMQPGRCPRGMKRTFEGEPIKGYYPVIISEEDWNRVQLIRSKNFAHGKVEVGKVKGRGGRSNWKNIFLGLLYDQDGNTVIYKQIQDNWAHLISNDRSKFKTHKVRYALFQRAILEFLNDIDWASLTNPDHQKELDAIEVKLQKTEQKLARFNRYLQGDEEPPELLMQNIKKAEKEQKELLIEREAILARSRATQALQGGIPTIKHQEPRRESNIRLREEIRKRISRIDLVFGVRKS